MTTGRKARWSGTSNANGCFSRCDPSLFIFFETEAKDLPHPLIKQKRIAQLINGKPGENRHNPLSGTHRIPHTPLSEEGLVELAHTCHRHHFSSSGVIAIPNPRANDSDFTVDEHQHNPHHRASPSLSAVLAVRFSRWTQKTKSRKMLTIYCLYVVSSAFGMTR